MMTVSQKLKVMALTMVVLKMLSLDLCAQTNEETLEWLNRQTNRIGYTYTHRVSPATVRVHGGVTKFELEEGNLLKILTSENESWRTSNRETDFDQETTGLFSVKLKHLKTTPLLETDDPLKEAGYPLIAGKYPVRLTLESQD